MIGNFQRDYIYGGSGNLTIAGGSGNDRIWGEPGNDYLYGYGGNDMIRGGNGAIPFVAAPAMMPCGVRTAITTSSKWRSLFLN